MTGQAKGQGMWAMPLAVKFMDIPALARAGVIRLIKC